MSRTRCGGKGPGHEFWGRRSVGGKELRDPGPFTKRQTHRKERRLGKKEAAPDYSGAVSLPIDERVVDAIIKAIVSFWRTV